MECSHCPTQTDTDKKLVIKNCVEVFILLYTDTDTDAIGFQTHFGGVGIGQCKHTVKEKQKSFLRKGVFFPHMAIAEQIRMCTRIPIGNIC